MPNKLPDDDPIILNEVLPNVIGMYELELDDGILMPDNRLAEPISSEPTDSGAILVDDPYNIWLELPDLDSIESILIAPLLPLYPAMVRVPLLVLPRFNAPEPDPHRLMPPEPMLSKPEPLEPIFNSPEPVLPILSNLELEPVSDDISIPPVFKTEIDGVSEMADGVLVIPRLAL